MRWERLHLPVGQGQHGALQEVGHISGPGKRWGHSCNAIKEGRYLYVFGGYGNENCQTNLVHVFDTANQTWSEPEIKGIPPNPRDSHTCTTVGDNLYIFGGTDGTNPLKDFLIFDTSLNTWTWPNLRGEGPEAREGHGAALVGKRLFIFGGCGKSSNDVEVYYNDLYILNTETFVWKRATTSGTPPSPRHSHTCSSWKNKVIVIGGEDAHDYYLSDVHILDTDTLNWTELRTSGQFLLPRAGHTTVAFENNLFVFGGFTDAQNLFNDLYMLDIDTGIWTKVVTSGDGPSPRFSVAGACLDPQKGGVLAFIGGCNRSLEALDDMYFLNTGFPRENEWRLDKLSLRKQLKLKCQEQNQNILHDEAHGKIGTESDIHQPMLVLAHGHQSAHNYPLNQSLHLNGKKMFRAKVTESILNGYTIETVIDGRPLHGVLFANKPKYVDFACHSSRKKRTAENTGNVLLNGDFNLKSKISRVVKLDGVNERLVDGVQEKGSALDEHQMNIDSDLAPSNASQPHEVTPNTDLTMPPSEPHNIQMHDAMDSNTLDDIEDNQNNLQDSKGNILKDDSLIVDNDTIVSIPSQGERMGIPLDVESHDKTQTADGPKTKNLRNDLKSLLEDEVINKTPADPL